MSFAQGQAQHGDYELSADSFATGSVPQPFVWRNRGDFATGQAWQYRPPEDVRGFGAVERRP